MAKNDEKLEEALQQAKLSLEIEGLTVTEEHTRLVRAVLTNQMTEEEFHEEVMKLVKSK